MSRPKGKRGPIIKESDKLELVIMRVKDLVANNPEWGTFLLNVLDTLEPESSQPEDG